MVFSDEKLEKQVRVELGKAESLEKLKIIFISHRSKKTMPRTHLLKNDIF